MANGQWGCYPLPGAKVISPYGGKRKHHSGTDIKTKANDNIYAAFDGEVTFSGDYHGYGKLIRIKHPNGLETYYAHNSKNLVKTGQHVRAGKVIAYTGQTGRASTPHLHFETRVNGKVKDPKTYIDFKNQKRRK
jgi:murein DD-endopeptidase MepM/ murein hydrolase activator NlpD